MFAAYAALIAVTCIWGLTFPVVQDSLEFASPLVFVALRFLLAAALLLSFTGKRALQLNRELIYKGLWLGLLLWGGYAAQTVGLQSTSSARAAFITGTFVPLTPVFAWLLFRAHVTLRMWIAVGLAFAGVAIMAQPEIGFSTGDIWAQLCAICFALQLVYVNRWVHRDNEVQLTWLQLATTGVLAALLIPTDPARLVLSGYLVFGLCFTALFASALAIWAQLRFQPRLPVSAAAVIFSLEPLTAGLAAWLLQDHIPPLITVLGATFIVAGMILSSTVKQREIAPV
jgi:drug/metabolite transporter (DMT)-like permease